MHASVLATFLLTLASAAELPENALCGDSVECQKNCYGGRFHVVETNGTGSFFGCTLDGVNNYRSSYCIRGDTLDKAATMQACDAASGRQCEKRFKRENAPNCIVLASNAKTFAEACKEINTDNIVKYLSYKGDVSYEQASKDGDCDHSVPFP